MPYNHKQILQVFSLKHNFFFKVGVFSYSGRYVMVTFLFQ